jgi:hypothetical protein
MVVFPAPLGPRRPKHEDSAAEKLSEFTALNEPNVFVTVCTLIAGVFIDGAERAWLLLTYLIKENTFHTHGTGIFFSLVTARSLPHHGAGHFQK